MPLDQVPGQDDIMATLRTIPGVTVYEGQYLTDGAAPPMNNDGLFKPYITTVFGASYQANDRSIDGEQHQPLFTTATVYCVAPSDRIARQYRDKVRNLLTGFVPEDGTQLAAYGGYIYVDADLGVNRYVHSIVFRYTTNMSYTT